MSKQNLSQVVSRPNFSQDEEATLTRFAESGSKELTLVKNILSYYIEDLGNIMNIDPKGNMGLQSLARQEAFGVVSSIAKLFTPDIIEHMQKSETKKTISPWR